MGALETHEVSKKIDIFFFEDSQSLGSGINTIIKNYSHIIVGISFFTTQLWDIHSLMQQLRKKYKKRITYIAGGPHPTGDPKGTLKLGFDLVVVGEGEKTLIELLEKLISDEDFQKIKGLAFKDEKGTFQSTGKRAFIDLNEYPPFPLKHSKFGALEITRGCPYVCYFCQTPHILGITPRHRAIEIICKYIKIMKERNLTNIRFITPNAFSYGSLDGKSPNIAKLRELLKRIKEIISPTGRIYLGSFPSEVRPEHVNKDTLNLIKEYCANDNIIIGAQSGSQKILDLCHRGHSLEDILNAVKITVEYGLTPNVDFIFGLPHEDKEDIKLTIDLMERLVELGARIHTHSFVPLPQTPFAQEHARKIDKTIRAYIHEMNVRGFAYGDWKKQERLALKISNYLQTGKM